MIHVHDAIRERLFARAGIRERPAPRFTPADIDRLEQTEWSPEFERLMRNRLIMGALDTGRSQRISTGINALRSIGIYGRRDQRQDGWL